MPRELVWIIHQLLKNPYYTHRPPDRTSQSDPRRRRAEAKHRSSPTHRQCARCQAELHSFQVRRVKPRTMCCWPIGVVRSWLHDFMLFQSVRIVCGNMPVLVRTLRWNSQLATHGPSVGWFPDQRQIGMFLICSVPMVCLVPDKADSLLTNKGRLGRIRSLVVLAAFSMHRETG